MTLGCIKTFSSAKADIKIDTKNLENQYLESYLGFHLHDLLCYFKNDLI